MKLRKNLEDLALGTGESGSAFFVGFVGILVTLGAFGGGFRASSVVPSRDAGRAVTRQTVPTSGVVRVGTEVLVRLARGTPFHFRLGYGVEHVRPSSFEFGHRIREGSKIEGAKMMRGLLREKGAFGGRSFVPLDVRENEQGRSLLSEI